jgi:hypothetical protein
MNQMQAALRQVGIALYEDPDLGYVVTDEKGRSAPVAWVNSFLFDGKTDPSSAATEVARRLSSGARGITI